MNPSNKTARKMPVIPGSSESAVIVNGQSYSYAVKRRSKRKLLRSPKAEGQSKAHVVVLPNLMTGTIAEEKPNSSAHETLKASRRKARAQ
jgi:hypothetical protein